MHETHDENGGRKINPLVTTTQAKVVALLDAARAQMRADADAAMTALNKPDSVEEQRIYDAYIQDNHDLNAAIYNLFVGE